MKPRATPRRILFVAYPLLPVSETSCGGAEQVLHTLEQKLCARGHVTTVAGTHDSQAAGTVYPTRKAANGALASTTQIERDHARKVRELIHIRASIGRAFDIIHDQSGSYFHHAAGDSPVLTTLHLPRNFYPADFFRRIPDNVYFNCVSKSQAEDFRELKGFVGVVENGIQLDKFPLQAHKRDYLLWMGRICEEKGLHIALDVARHTGQQLVVAGKVYPLAYHQRYFDLQIRPRMAEMGAQVKFIESPSFAEKVDLLRHAKAVLIPSLAPETSSLVAMEAAACGTPVVAFSNGALPDIVRDRITGYVVNDAGGMVHALSSISRIRAKACRDHAQRFFSADRMVTDYEALYDRVIQQHWRKYNTQVMAA